MWKGERTQISFLLTNRYTNIFINKEWKFISYLSL